VVLPVCRGEGDPVECGSCRRIRLLEHAMKVVGGGFERGVRQRIVVDDMRFEFMKGRGTTDAIFLWQDGCRRILELKVKSSILVFYRAMLCIRGTSHGPVSICLSVSVSVSVCVRLSQVGVLLKRLNIGSHKQHQTIVQRL